MDRKMQNRLRAIREAEEKLSYATPKEAYKLTEQIAKWKAQLF